MHFYGSGDIHDINDIYAIDTAAGQCWVSFLVVFIGGERNVVVFTKYAVEKDIGIIVAKLAPKLFSAG